MERSDTLQTWGEEVDPLEDSILLAKSEEGERLCDALDEFQTFLHEDIRHKTFETPEELVEAMRIFDGLVEQTQRRFAAYIAKLDATQEEHHGHA